MKWTIFTIIFLLQFSYISVLKSENSSPDNIYIYGKELEWLQRDVLRKIEKFVKDIAEEDSKNVRSNKGHSEKEWESMNDTLEGQNPKINTTNFLDRIREFFQIYI